MVQAPTLLVAGVGGRVGAELAGGVRAEVAEAPGLLGQPQLGRDDGLAEYR